LVILKKYSHVHNPIKQMPLIIQQVQRSIKQRIKFTIIVHFVQGNKTTCRRNVVWMSCYLITLNCKDTCSIYDDQVWSIGGMRLTKENRNTHNMAWPGIEPMTPFWEASGYLPEQWYKPLTIYDNNYIYFCRGTKTLY
jgi:hypothetical protein